ncbi:type II secretion system protein GspG [Cytophagaceae bacterium DM2B3-1]|uniref:Type II secretion system protein GspG n=1 Tax=Xanthocytophaga flava TaxID=3048013 RepID=A0ABT7CX55_9BACT|nr:type II secretion system protein GspG [Xanthocytophaga flavus]MDJ1498361.1 type II secretion system protein GspG [Xanthocytophaga flavus]
MKSSHPTLYTLLYSAGITLFCTGFVFAVVSLLSGFLPGLMCVFLMVIGYLIVCTMNQGTFTLPFVSVPKWNVDLSSINYTSILRSIVKSTLTTLLILALIISCVFIFGQNYFHKRATRQECDQIVSALQFYKESTKNYPTTLREVIGNDPLRRDWDKDDWENVYQYKTINNGQSFMLRSCGVDGKPDTEDDLLYQDR